MITRHMYTRIKQLKQEGKNISQISVELKMSRNTISKYLKSYEPPQYTARVKSTRKDPLNGFETYLKTWLESSPDLTDQEIFELLMDKGYKGSVRTINNKLKSYRLPKVKERFFEQVYEPGEQVQFDFKEDLKIKFIDKIRKVHLHFSSLPYSSKYHIKAYPFKNFQCYIDGIHSCFESLGGIPKNLRIDNLSPCISKVYKYGRRKYTKECEQAIEYYQLNILPCNPARGNEKGHVERDIRTYSSRIKNKIDLYKIVFKDWEHLNQWLKDEFWGKQDFNDPLFLKEKAAFKDLPPRSDNILNRIDITKPSSLGSVRINESTYSVPDELIGKECKVSLGAYNVTITELKKNSQKAPIIITHPRQEKGINHICLEHVITSLSRKPKSMMSWKHKNILFPHETCPIFYDYLKNKLGYRAEQDYLKTLNLIHHVSWDDLIAAMDLVIENQSDDPYIQIQNILFSHNSPQTNSKLLWSPKPLQPNLSKYDKFTILNKENLNAK